MNSSIITINLSPQMYWFTEHYAKVAHEHDRDETEKNPTFDKFYPENEIM